MSDTVAELEKIKGICPGAEIWTEGGRPHVFLPDLKIMSDGKSHRVDALLCPYERDGYPSRLFLQHAFPGRGQNWKTFNICGKTWHACSWKGISAKLPWLEMLLGHLRVLL